MASLSGYLVIHVYKLFYRLLLPEGDQNRYCGYLSFPVCTYKSRYVEDYVLEVFINKGIKDIDNIPQRYYISKTLNYSLHLCKTNGVTKVKTQQYSAFILQKNNDEN